MQEEIEAVFGRALRGHGYIRIRCPYHSGGKEKHPSMSILTEPKNGFQEGFCKCFTCGWTGTVEQLFKDAGYAYKPHKVKPTNTPIVLNIRKAETKQQMIYKFSSYLAKRNISSITQSRFRTYEEGGKVHMPVFDRAGKYLFKISRSLEAKQYYVEEGAQKTTAYIEEIDFTKPVYVVESQINAMSLFELGLQAVATLGAASTQPLKQALAQAQHIILAFDPDEAGMLATEKCLKMFGSYRARYLELPEKKDINDILCDMLSYGCPKSEIIDYLKSCERFIYLSRGENDEV